jgi:hypothetical protein
VEGQVIAARIDRSPSVVCPETSPGTAARTVIGAPVATQDPQDRC